MNALPRRLDARSQKKENRSIVRYIVVGGGIAGVCCAQEIARLKKHDSIEVVIITATELLKESAGVMKITNHLEELSVFERTADRFSLDNPGIRVIHGSILSIDTSNKIVRLKDDSFFIYEKLCICTGAQPKMIATHPNIIGIRDLQSVAEMTERLSIARKVIIVGNGGIALELVHSLSFCDVDWIVRDSFLGSSFFDASASAFVMPGLSERISASSSKIEIDSTGLKKTIETVPIDTSVDASVGSIDAANTDTTAVSSADIAMKGNQKDLRHQGAALGPEWLTKSKLLDNLPGKLKQSSGSLNIHYQQDIVALREGLHGSWKVIGQHDNDASDLDEHINSDIDAAQKINSMETSFQDPLHSYPLYVLTSNKNVLNCDFLVSATGVIPCVDFVSSEFLRSDESSCDTTTPSSSTIDLNSTEESSTDIKSKKRKLEDVVRRKEGALAVNELMETSVKDVYAAGDCCCYQSSHKYHTNEINSIADDASSNIMAGRHWFQMRLWTQARSMGLYAAQCLCGDQDNHGGDFAFEIFAHATRFFGYKVVLLGRYNAQGLGIHPEVLSKTMIVSQDGLQMQDNNEADICDTGDRKIKKENDIEIWTRMTNGVEYVKVVVYKGKVVGAMLIGDTGLEEVFENLILNKLDVSAIGIDLLDPSLDLEDYFD